jgi:hypothetical protein
MKKQLFFLLFTPLYLQGQWHDANWHFAGFPYFETQGNPPPQNAIANTLGNEPTFEVTDSYLQNFGYSNTMSDKDGNLLFYCNNMKIYNKNHVLMESGGNINAGEAASNPVYINYGYPIFYTMVCVPVGDNRYYLFHSRQIDECHADTGADILYSIIDMNLGDGLGRVVEKNTEIKGCDLGAWFSLSACRHANGRDWWVLATNINRNRYFRVLLTPSGISDTATIAIDSAFSIEWGSGRSVFTPDGNRFIDCRNARSARVYEFDRCTGALGSYQDIPTFNGELWGLGIGATVSSNSRFLYLSSGRALAQVDLHADNMASTLDTIAIFDGFYDVLIYNLGMISWLQLMPNGVIYSINNGLNSTRYLHQVAFPDKKNADSKPSLHSIRAPISVSSMPYFPNYRLGPIDGSACDTLGINNLPLAHYRWDVEDTLAPLSVTFTDLSAYEPATWSWDFGDGSAVSQDTSPVHVFPAPGVYTVCLTVCNDYACDTLCREVTVGFSSTASPEQAAAGIVLYPNPASSSFTLQKAEGVFPQGARVALYNSTGQLMQERRAAGGETSMVFSWEQYPAGVYWLRVDMPDAGTLVRKAIKKG